MGKIASFVLGALALLVASLPTPAAAQSSCVYIVPGAVLTAGQWNFCFQGKLDALGYVPINPAALVGVSPIVVTPSAGVVQFSCPTCAAAAPSTFAATLPLTVAFPAGVVTYGFDLTHANSWTGDQYFGGRPFCDPIAYGAVPDGATNSLAAFNACLTALGGGGGTIWLDNIPGTGSTYCLTAASQGAVFNLNAPIRLMASRYGVTLSSCGSGFSVMQISAASIVDGVQILGPGYDGEAGFGAVQPALLLTNGANGTKLFNMLVYGGAPTIQWNCPECQAYNVNGAFAYVNGSAVAAEWYFQAGGGELYNVSADDNEYPYGTPTPPFTYTAWATNQSVATNAVRTATCQDGNSYVIQAKVGGTTANSGTGPTCKNYGGAGGGTFTDGTVTWSISHPTLLYHWQMDTGATDVHIHQADTGGGNVGFGLTNTLAGNAPSSITCVTCNGGVSYTAQVDVKASGGDIRFVSDNFGGCVKTGCFVVTIESTSNGGVEFSGGNAFGGSNGINGISIAGGTNYRIFGMNLTGNATAVSISGSTSKVVVNGNNVNGATTGINISGTASDIVFTNNVGCVSGSTTCFTNTSSGANVITLPNDGGVAYAIQPGTTKITGACSGGGVLFTLGTDVRCNGNITTTGFANLQVGAFGGESDAAWTTNGIRYQNPALTYNDATSSGTVAAAYTDLFGASTITATSATTYTNYYGSYFQAPVASTNVTMTHKYALGADSANFTTLAVGGAALLPVSVANGGTGCTVASITCFNNITGFSAAGTTGTTSTNLVFSTSPTLVTPALGVATATSVNGLVITTTTGTLTIASSKVLTVNNSLNFSGTDATTMTLPTTSATLARTDVGQTFTGTNVFGAVQGTSLALGGATIGGNALAVTGTTLLSGAATANVASTVASGTSATLDDVNVQAATTTVTGTTAITTAKGFNKVSLYQPTITDSSSVTISKASTLYVDNAPLAAGSVTITQPWALNVGAGDVFVQGANETTTITSGTGATDNASIAIQRIITSSATASAEGLVVDVQNNNTTASKVSRGISIYLSVPSGNSTAQGNMNALNIVSEYAGTGGANATNGGNLTVGNLGTGTITTSNGYAILMVNSGGGTNTATDSIKINQPTGATIGLTSVWTNINGIEVLDQNPTGAGTNTLTNPPAAILIDSQTASGAFLLNTGSTGIFQVTTASINFTALANTATTSAVCYNTGTGRISYDGTLGTCTVSDETLKNIGPRIDNALERLLQINGFYFTFKNPTAYGRGEQIGVGAQTVEKVFPELVSTDSEGHKSLAYDKLAAPIIEALRELKADNDNLREELKRRTTR